MKGDRIGEFEEFTLLAVHALGARTYGVPVQQFVERSTGRDVSIGAVYGRSTASSRRASSDPSSAIRCRYVAANGGGCSR